MAKILIYSDVHFSQTSSILRKMGDKYTVRLEKLIESVNWAESLADTHNCDEIVCLGDFFDTPHLGPMEISALSDIKWSNKPHTFVLGNHEIKTKNRDISSLHLIKLLGFELITEPTVKAYDDIEICYLPYMFEHIPIENIFNSGNKKIILSHNDIKNVELNGYIFDSGFSIENINEKCELFLNGHIHTYGKYGNMINVGNLCGQNFSENNVKHRAYILDTDSLELESFDNPYAINFYKFNFVKKVGSLNKIKENAVVSIKCSEKNVDTIKELVDNNKNIIEIKYIIVSEELTSDIKLEEENIAKIDHLQSLKDYIIDVLGNTEIVNKELNTLTK